MYEALLIIFLLVSIGLVTLIILQQSNSPRSGAFFGAVASSTLFGSRGSPNFITRIIAVLGALFFIISLILGNLSNNKKQKNNKWDIMGDSVKSEQTIIPTPPNKINSDIPK